MTDSTRSSPKFSHEPINEFFYDLLGNAGEDDRTSIDGVVSYALFRFASGIAPEDIDEYNEQQSAYEDQINASEVVMLCTEMVGAIVKETDDGFVTADLYSDVDTLERFWQEALDETTLEACDECQQESDEYGKGMPIAHLATCSQP